MSDLLPADDALYGLGSALKRWKDLRLSGEAFLDGVSYFNDVVQLKDDLRVYYDILQNIGSPIKRFLNAYIKNVIATTLTADTISEKTADAGVTIDGVLCKDGAIPETAVPVLTDAKYSNALLLDGTRVMTGNLDVGTTEPKYIYVGDARIRSQTMWGIPILWVESRAGGAAGFRAGGTCASGNFEAWGYFFCSTDFLTGGNPTVLKHKDIGETFREWARLIRETDNCRIDISRMGDLSIIEDRFLRIGKDSDGTLPTASADYRGKMIRVEGGAGVADKLYICMKTAADTYSWIQVASG